MMVWLIILAVGVPVLSIVTAVARETGYHKGVRHGRQLQAAEDRNDIELAVIAQARAEQMTETWARRARALLHAHFGSEHKS